MNDQTKKQQRGTDYPQGFALGYLYASTLQAIQHVRSTASTELSEDELAAGLGHLLLSAQGGQVLGSSDPVHPVRRKTTKRSKAVAKVAVGHHPRGQRASMTQQECTWVRDYLSDGRSAQWIADKLHRHVSTIHVLKKRIGAPVKKKRSYNGKHWTQTPKGRERMKAIQKARHSDDVEKNAA